MSFNAWDHASQLAEQHINQGGLFVRLNANGDKVVGAFCGEPFAREVVWTGERYEQYDPQVHTDKRASLRVMLNIFVPQQGEMKVIEGGTMWFKDVLKVRNKYGLDKWLFEIERHGDAGDTKTTYSILPEEKIDEATRALIAQAPLNDLAALVHGEERTQKSAAATEDAPKTSPATGPIDAHDISELVGRLKALPRAGVESFLSELGVQRVRDLQARAVPKAKAILDQLEASLRTPPEEDNYIDPFA